MRFRKGILISLFLIFFLLPKIGYITEPMMDWDEGVYQTAAFYIVNGYLPYRDFFEQKPPLIYYFYALCIKIYDSFISFRIAYFLIFFFTEVFLYLISRLYLNEFFSLFSVFLFSISTSSFWASSFNGEQLFLLPLLISIYLFLKGSEEKRIYFYIAGIMAALVFFIKYNGLIIIFPIFFLKFDWKKIFRFCIGFLLTSLLVFLFLFLNSIFRDFIFDTLIFNRKYIFVPGTKIFFKYGIYSLWEVFKDTYFVLIPSFLFFFYRFGRNEYIRLIKMFMIFSLISAIVPLKFLNHYFYPLVLFSSLGTVILLCKLKDSFRIKAILILFMVVIFLFYAVPSVKRASNFSILKVEKFYPPSVVSNFLERNSSPDDRIYLWRTHFLNTYYLSKRLPFTKYFFWYLLLRKPLPPKFLSEFKRDFKKFPPKFVVVGSSNIYRDKKFPLFEKMLEKKYEKVFSYKGERVYRLKN